MRASSVVSSDPSPSSPVWSEEDRLKALRRYEILDTEPEEDFDDIVKLAAEAFNMPVSLISFVDENRQFFKARVGFDGPEPPLAVSFCRYSLKEDEYMVVEDATKDARFKDNILVTGDPQIKFYAGAILKTPEGFPLGTVCVIDTVPRVMSPQDIQNLQTLARQVMTLLELKRALKEKERSEERLQFALDTSAVVGTWDWDLRKDVVFSDHRFADFYGVDPVQALNGVSIAEFVKGVVEEDRARVEATIRDVVKRNADYEDEYRVCNERGETRWMYVRGKAIYDHEGKPIRFPGAGVDITERKRYERKQAARMELNDRLREIKHTRDVTYVAAEIIGRALECTRAGYGEFLDNAARIKVEQDWCVPNLEPIAGIHEFKNYGEKFAESIRNGETIVINDIRDDPRCNTHLESYEKLGVRSLINVSLIEDGMPRALFFLHDSVPREWRVGEVELATEMALRTWAEAERVNAEEETKEALARAEAANIAKTEFLANMSHEIRTPMNAIIGLSNILSGENLTARQKEFVQTLQMSADSLLNLINDLLDIAKIEARTIELEQIPFDLTQLVQQVISMMNVKAREKGLDFSLAGDCTNDRYFIGDPTRIRQIVLNLCSNAIKFTDKGGIEIFIECHPMEDKGMENIHIAVKDTGIGIPANKIDDIFEKFIQADTSINRKFGGTGLGLAIAKTLAGIMGGTIRVESELGKGSVFTVVLPLRMAEDHEKTHNVDPTRHVWDENTDPVKKRVLLVEDYAPNVLVAGTFLEEFGYDWDSAKSGNEAVDLVMARHYDAILMDVQMFGMNGLEATRLIREYERTQKKPHVPIIGMTAHALSGDRERCIGVGMDDYISKPFNPDNLREKLQYFISGEKEKIPH